MFKRGILMLTCGLLAAAQQQPLNLVFMGDSLTEGVPHFNGESDTYPFMVGQAFAGSIYTKLGYRGQTTDFLLRQIGALFPLQKTGYNNVLVLWAGTNDCAIGPIACAAPVYDNLTAIAAVARAGGWRVVVVTMIARDNYFADDAHRAQFPSNQAAVNALLLNSAAFDAIADPAAALSDADDTTYFWDLCHLLPRGYALVAGKVIDAIRGLSFSHPTG